MKHLPVPEYTPGIVCVDDEVVAGEDEPGCLALSPFQSVLE